LSSALGSLLAAPRTLQALANDHIVPRFLGKGFGASNDPRIATAVTFLIAAVGVWIGTLDLIAPVLTMFFLTSYGILNLIAGIETLIGNPSWRPRFRVPWIVSFIGALACFGVMLLINTIAAYVAFFFCIGVYLVTKRREVNAQWTDMRRGLIMAIIRAYLYRLSYDESGRTWRPNLLVLSGAPTQRWHLIEFADAVSHGKGFLTVCSVVKAPTLSREKVRGIERSMREFLQKRGVPALTKVKVSEDLIEGIHGLVEDYGLGPIVPNTIVLGDTQGDEDDMFDFASLIRAIHDSGKNLVVVKRPTQDDVHETVLGQQMRANKVIDVWWGLRSDNGYLMLALSYMLQNSTQYMGSMLRVRSLVGNEEERQGVMRKLREITENGRIPARIDVFIRDEHTHPLDQIGSISRDADLVFVGMREQREDESIDEYSMYYDDLMKKIADLPTTIVALAGERMEFEKIFKE
jgi:hypothetical protein